MSRRQVNDRELVKGRNRDRDRDEGRLSVVVARTERVLFTIVIQNAIYTLECKAL